MTLLCPSRGRPARPARPVRVTAREREEGGAEKGRAEKRKRTRATRRRPERGLRQGYARTTQAAAHGSQHDTCNRFLHTPRHACHASPSRFQDWGNKARCRRRKSDTPGRPAGQDEAGWGGTQPRRCVVAPVAAHRVACTAHCSRPTSPRRPPSPRGSSPGRRDEHAVAELPVEVLSTSPTSRRLNDEGPDGRTTAALAAETRRCRGRRRPPSGPHRGPPQPRA